MPQTQAVTTTTSAAGATATATHTDHDEDDHDEDEPATGVPTAPSPTESVGCEAHGDHWHCDGPATATVSVTSPAVVGGVAQSTGSNGTTVAASPTSSMVPFKGAAASMHVLNAVKLAGIAGSVALLVAL